MTGEQFTQIKRPVSRLTEKVLGWLCWVMLLVLTVITMFIALVSFSNNTSIANLENTLNNNAFIQQLLAGNGYNTTQFVIWLQNGIWAIIVYFIVCLLISFLALISMNIRILSGFLFLISAIVTIPLVLLIVTLIIPILFFIIAMMLFIRKDKVEMVAPQYYEEYNGPIYDYREPVYERPQPKDDYYDVPKYEKELINQILYMIKNRKEINMINFLNVQLKVNIIMMSTLRKNHQYYPDRLNTNKKVLKN